MDHPVPLDTCVEIEPAALVEYRFAWVVGGKR